MFKCSFIPMSEYESLGHLEAKTKSGRYHGSMFWDIPGFASKKWVVAARILVEDEVPENTSDNELIEGCVDYINQPPPRKKYQKKKPVPKFGKLELYKAQIKKEEDKILILALLVTNDRKNKHFWGRGIIG